MPVTSIIIPELSLALRVYTGQVTASELKTAIKATYADPRYHEDMAEVDDLLDAQFVDVGFKEALDFARKAQEYHRERGYMTPLCFVVTQAEAQSSISMFEVFSEMVGATQSMYVVPGYAEVLAILDLPAASLRLLPESRQMDQDLL